MADRGPWIQARELRDGDWFRLPSGRERYKVDASIRHLGDTMSIITDGVPVLELDVGATVVLMADGITPPNTDGATCAICGREQHTHNEAVECLKFRDAES
jgi:hypothetical protein